MASRQDSYISTQDFEEKEAAKGPIRSFEVDEFDSINDFDPNLYSGKSSREFLNGVTDSPYPEVRAVVPNIDDPDMPVSTIRAWVIGLFWTILAPGVNQFFSFRYPSIGIGLVIIMLVTIPMGRGWARIAPRWTLFGASLNPGPFTVKEHVLIMILSGVALGPAYATDIFAVQKLTYGQEFNFIYQWLVVMSTQLIGFSFGGIARRILVDSPAMIWPGVLQIVALFYTLHSTGYSQGGNSGGISRRRLFAYACGASFVWYWIPGYLFQALSWFSWVTWIRPDNAVIAQLFGVCSGLGMGVITFDWSQISALGPMITPWWTQANIIIGFLFFSWFLAPILYFTNTWYSKYMPMMSFSPYDNQGQPYDVTQILNPDLSLNLDAYRSYSPMFLSLTFALSYGLSFATVTATLVHAILYYRKLVWRQLRHSIYEQDDIHAQLMSKYRSVPSWWYAAIFLATFVAGVIAIRVFPTQLPVWAFILSLVISALYIIPVGIMAAITNQAIGLNVLTELIIGYALPGKPVAMMLFKSWGYNTMMQALNFISDMKTGHYMKIPPRVMFTAQIVATIVAGTVQLGVQAWALENIPDVCSPRQKNRFICPDVNTFALSSVLWGAIGPGIQFSKGQTYNGLLYFFLVGALAPVVTWVLSNKYPQSFWKYVNTPIIFTTSVLPPLSGINFIPSTIVGFIFQYWLKRHRYAWWSKYNFILAIALDTGIAVAALAIFFFLQFPRNGEIGLNTIQSWIGNTVYMSGADFRGDPVIKLAPGETFGPSAW